MRASPVRATFAVFVALAIVASSATAKTSTGAEGIPRFSHVVVLVLENENASATWGKASVAHYLNSLVHRGVFASQYYATGHVSLDNYIAMVSGQPAETGCRPTARSNWSLLATSLVGPIAAFRAPEEGYRWRVARTRGITPTRG